MKSPRKFPVLFLAGMFGLSAIGRQTAHGAGVTILTHGHLGNVDEWVIPMAAAIPAYARFPSAAPGQFSCYQVTVVANGNGFNVSTSFLDGSPATNATTGEIFIKLDWSDIANDLISDSTEDIAAAVVPSLLQTNFIAGLGGHALAELPLHLVGHSRGGSLVCEMARRLGLQGVWVDHVTLLDPHPVNNDGFFDPLLPFVTDASARVYENVLFADNYWETLEDYPNGKSVAGCYNRRLTSLDGGYSSEHSDAHLWYHGTIDWRTPTSDTQADLTGSERQNWWSVSESNGVNAGYVLSRLGGSSRTADSAPAGPGTGRILDGYNQRWNLGVAGTPNRSALSGNNGSWPSLILARLSGTNVIEPGGSLLAHIAFQHARPVTSNVVLRLALDPDGNPLNGNEQALGSVVRASTGAAEVAIETIPFPVPRSGVADGTYRVAVTIQDGPRARHLYMQDPVTLTTRPEPPRLTIERSGPNQVSVTVLAAAGERIVLERSQDLVHWLSIATNRLASDTWSVLEPATPAGGAFYRALETE